MKQPSFGFVIQGPLDSRGFDTRDTIAEYCAVAAAQSELKIRLCVSTWKGQKLGALAELAGRFDFLQNEDPGKPDLHNRRRQIVSSLNGAKLLNEKYQPDYIIKIRADQRLDLVSMCSHILRLEQLGRLTEETLVAPAASREIAFFVLDFYFGGRARSVVRFLETVLEQSESPMQHAVEIDIMLKYFRSFPGSKVSALGPYVLRTQYYFCPWLARNSTRKAFDAAWRQAREHIRFFSRQLYVDMKWRGKGNNITFISDLYFDGEDRAPGEFAKGEPRSEHQALINTLMRLILFLYTVELLVCSLLHIRSRNVFIRLAERYRARTLS